MFHWIAILSVALALIVFLTRKNVRTVGPAELPIIQGGLWLAQHRHRLLEVLVEKTLEYNTTWTVKWPLSPRYFFITDPANLEHVLKTNFNGYEKGPYFRNALGVLLGHGIFNTDGQEWEDQRKLASHMFSRREFEATIMETFARHAAVLERVLARAAATGQPLDLQNVFFRFTLDSIGSIAFGEDIASLENADVPFAKAFDAAQAAVEQRFFSPGWQVTELLDGTRASINAAVAVLDEYCAGLIQRRRAAGDFTRRRDLLSRFMSVTEDGAVEYTGEGSPAAVAVETDASPAASPKPKPVYKYLHSDKFLRDVVLNFMIAGRDTTAQCLSWTVHCLSQNPDVEARMVEELRSVIGMGAFGAPAGASGAASAGAGAGSSASGTSAPAATSSLSYDTVSKGLKYTQAVLQETLRLYPSVPKDVKQAMGDDTLPDKTFIPAGSLVAYIPHTMGRLPSLWGEDALAYKPDRFLSGAKHSQFKFIAFNAGRRTCLGQHMALVEASVVLAVLYRRYRVRVLPGQHITYQESLTLPMKHGIKAVLEPRA